jgi:hypothetical protein
MKKLFAIIALSPLLIGGDFVYSWENDFHSQFYSHMAQNASRAAAKRAEVLRSLENARKLQLNKLADLYQMRTKLAENEKQMKSGQDSKFNGLSKDKQAVVLARLQAYIGKIDSSIADIKRQLAKL